MFEYMVAVMLALLGTLCVTTYNGIHVINEGHVGVYWRGGRILDNITDPGWQIKLPMIDSYSEVQITMQSDSVKEIPCGTSGGVVIFFETVEVVNRLKKENVHKTIKDYGIHYDKLWIFDKIHHEINQFCSKHSLREVFIEMFDTLDDNLMKALQDDCDKYNTGIDIITVRVTKPRIPDSVRSSYEDIEAQKALLILANERHKLVEKEAETESNLKRIRAENQKAIRVIDIQKEIAEREGAKKMKEIESMIYLAEEKAKADAALYTVRLEAEANQLRLTPEFLKYSMITAIGNMSKVYFGESIPKMMMKEVEQGVLMGRDVDPSRYCKSKQ